MTPDYRRVKSSSSLLNQIKGEEDCKLSVLKMSSDDVFDA